MKTWNNIKEEYLKEHYLRNLKQPERRPNALKAIEKLFVDKNPTLMTAEKIQALGVEQLMQEVQKLKGSNLSGAEKSVIRGLAKFSN